MIMYYCSLTDKNHKDKNSIDYFELWKDWSKQSDNYESDCCEKLWKTLSII